MVISLGSQFLTAWISSLNSKLNYCKSSPFCWYQCINHVAVWVTIGTKKTAASRKLSHYDSLHQLAVIPTALPKANSLGFQLVTVAIFSSFNVQSKYNLGFLSKGGMSSIRELFAKSLWDWCMTWKAWVVSSCVLCWHCNKLINELFIAVTLCSNWSCCKCQSCLCHLPNLEEEELSEPLP